MWTLTGNDVFDFYFGLPAMFAFAGWGIGMVRGAVRRFIR